MNNQNYEKYYIESARNYDPQGEQVYLTDDRYYNIQHFIKEITPRKRILDIGCGNGWISTLYRLQGDEIHGIDLIDLNIDRAKAKGLVAVKQNVEEALPYQDGYFDIVLISEVVEHLFAPEVVLSEINRILKKGSHLILSTPNLYSLENRVKVLFGRNCIIEYPPNIEHIRHYSVKGIKKLLEKHGFKVIKMRGESWYIMFQSLWKIVSLVHGGNRGLKFFLKMVSFGKIKDDWPGLRVRFYVQRVLGRLFPSLSAGMIFKAVKVN